MKKIGLLGGMSWESTDLYYQGLNRGVRQRLGGLSSAQIVLRSLDFAPLAQLQTQGAWDLIADILANEAVALEESGADFIVITSNTMHKLCDQISARLSIPLLRIEDSCATAILKQGLKKIGLLGTKFTMEQDFYRQRLHSFGLEIVIPSPVLRDSINSIIFSELCQGKILDASRPVFLQALQEFKAQDCQGVILGCTEIPLILKSEHTTLPLFDTANLHVEAALNFMFEA
jgi:aspartate racemase